MSSFTQLLGGIGLEDFDFGSPQSWAFVIMLSIALLYGVTLSLLYSVYFKEGEARDDGLARSFIFLTPTLMTIFWVVQFSLPLSVGLVGTLSFVRFRSPVKRAEDVSFIVIALACSISCAVHKPMMGGALILVFLVYAFGRNFFNQSRVPNAESVLVTYNTKKATGLADLETLLGEFKCYDYQFISSNLKDGVTSVVFKIPQIHQNQLGVVAGKLESADKDSDINILFPPTQSMSTIRA